MKKAVQIFLCGIMFTAINANAQPAKKLSSKRPNVILIYTDDQGTLDMHCYGARDLYTPNMDALAAAGTRFTQFYAAAPICSPSRASLLTGRYPQRAGLPNMASSTKGVDGMPGSQYTLGELFKSAGYQTAHIGKWHVGYTAETMPNQQGFDYSFGFMGGCIDNYSHYFYWSGPPTHDLWRNGKEVFESGKYFQDLMVTEVNQYLTQHQHKPFFLYWAINLPHYPEQSKAKWINYYKKLPYPRNIYAAVISTMDDEIGMVLKKLKSLGLDDNTIVILQSDQGFSREDRANFGGGYAGPYRGSKFSLFEGGIRVPAVIKWSKHLPAHSVRQQLATNIDWFPTLAELCGIRLPDRKIDGVSLMPIIRSEKAVSPHTEFFWQSGGGKENPQWAVRDGNWKLLHSPFESKPQELNADHYMLINMAKDSSEQVNEANTHPELLRSMTEKYRQWLKDVILQ